MEVVDAFELDEAPGSLDEGFVTFDEAAVSDDGRSVVLGDVGDGAVTLRAAEDTPGTFTVRELSESVEQGRDGRLVRGLTFTPATLAQRMVLKFTVT